MARNYIKLKQLEPTGLASLVRTSETGDFLTTGNYSGYAESTFYTRANPSGYVRAAETGILASDADSTLRGTGWVNANYVSRSESGAFYEASNPSGYVRAVETGILAGTGTGVAESTGWVNANYVARTETGILAGTGIGTSQGTGWVFNNFVATGETGILAGTGTGVGQGTGWIDANFYPRSNPSGYNGVILVSTGEPSTFDTTGNLWLDTSTDCSPTLKAYDRCDEAWSPALTIGTLTQVVFNPHHAQTDGTFHTFDGETEDTLSLSVSGHPNAAIYYTSGTGAVLADITVSDPDTGSALYSTNIKIPAPTGNGVFYVFKARAYLSYYNSSSIESGSYFATERFPLVEFTPRNYPSDSLGSVTLEVPGYSGESKIYYTLQTGERTTVEGTAATPTTTVFTGQGVSPLSVDTSTLTGVSYNIKAIAANNPSSSTSKRTSLVSSSSYHVERYNGNPTLPAITLSPTTGSFQFFPLQVTPSIVGHPLTGGTVFYYTTDGSEPTINSDQLHSGSTESYITLNDSAGTSDPTVKIFASKYLYDVSNTLTGSYQVQAPQISPADGSSIRFGTGFSGISILGPTGLFYVVGDPSTGTVPEPIVNASTSEFSGRTQQYTGEFFLDHTFTSGRVIAVGLNGSVLTETKTGTFSKRLAAVPTLDRADGSTISGQGETLTLTASDVDVDFHFTSGSSPSDPTTGSTLIDASNSGTSSTGALTIFPSDYKFISAGTGLQNSAVVSATYNEFIGSTDDITFSPDNGSTLDFSGSSITINIANGFSGFVTTGLSTPEDPIITGDSNLENYTASGSNSASGIASGTTINTPLNDSTSAATLTIKVISVKNGYKPSPVKSSVYFKQRAAAITIDPLGVISSLGESVTLSSTDSPIEYYIETGASGSVSEPTTSSSGYFANYGESLTLNAGNEIKAFAWRSGFRASATASTAYETGQETNDISLAPDSGATIRFGASGVTFSVTSGSTGYFTTGIGSLPEDPKVTGDETLSNFNVSGANTAQAYSSAVTFPYTNESAQETGHIKYLMVTPGYSPSDVKLASYTKRKATDPTLNPTGGSVNATGQSLSITTTDSDVDFHIESGATVASVSTPTTGSSGFVRDFSSTLNVRPTGDLKVLTWGSGLIPSDVVSADYDYQTAENVLTFSPSDSSSTYNFDSLTVIVNNIPSNSVVFLTTGNQATFSDLEDPKITGNEEFSAFGVSGSNSAFAYDVTNGFDAPDTGDFKLNIKAVVATTGKLISTTSGIQYSNQLLPVISAQDVSGVTPAYPDGSYDVVQGETFRFRVSGSAGSSPTVSWFRSGSAGEQAVSNDTYHSITTTTPTTQVTFSILDVTGAADNTKPTYYAKISNAVGTVTGDQTTVKFYDSRIADPTFNIPSGSKIADNGSNFDITTITGGASNALTFVKTSRTVSLASLADPDGNIDWENDYYASAFQFFSDTAIKMWSSGVDRARTNVIGLSFVTGSLSNQNYFIPSSGSYYDKIEVRVPQEDLELWTLDGFSFPRVNLVYNSGATGTSVTAPTASSYSGIINLTYDSVGEQLTGELDVSADFNVKSLVVEDSTSYGVNFTGEVETSFENRIKFSDIVFLRNLTHSDNSAVSTILGQNTTINSVNPVRVEGGSHILALDSAGNLYGLGSNSNGQLGLGDTNYKHTPVLIATDVRDFDAAGSHSAIITGDSKSLYTFGHNFYGQLGLGDTSTRLSPTLVETGVLKVRCGSSHTAFISSSNQLKTCGYNYHGQLGVATNFNTSNDNPTPTVAKSNVADVDCGTYHTLVKNTSNTAFGFGYSLAFNAGSNSYSNQFNKSNITKISAGGSHNALVDSSNNLFVFGSNSYGESFGDSLGSASATGVFDVSVGSNHTLFLTDSNAEANLSGVGNSTYGQLGNSNASNTTPVLVATGVDSGDFTALGLNTHFVQDGDGYNYSQDTANNLAVLNYVTGEGGVGNPSGANTIGIPLLSLGSEKLVNAAVRYSIDGTDPSTGDFAFATTDATGATTGTTNLFFLPETGLDPFATGTGDLTLKYIAISTGDSTGDLGDSLVTTTVIERKTLSPQIKVTYYDDILDTETTVSGFSTTGFNDQFNRNATVEINFSNYDTGSVGELEFYKNTVLQSTANTQSRTLEIGTSDNTNTGTITFSGSASGYKVTGSDITGIFERHRLFSGNISPDTPSGVHNAPVVYRVELVNNTGNPTDSSIVYTTDGSEPNSTSSTFSNFISINAAPDPGNNVTIRHKVFKAGYLISEEGPSGTYEIIEQT